MCCLWVLQVQSTHSATHILIFSECCECLPKTSNGQHRGRIKPVNLCLYVICALIESTIICNSSITAVSLQSNDLLVYCCESHFLDPWDICYVKKNKKTPTISKAAVAIDRFNSAICEQSEFELFTSHKKENNNTKIILFYAIKLVYDEIIRLCNEPWSTQGSRLFNQMFHLLWGCYDVEIVTIVDHKQINMPATEKLLLLLLILENKNLFCNSALAKKDSSTKSYIN